MCRNAERQHAAVQQQRVLIPSAREGKESQYFDSKIIVKSTISGGKCQVKECQIEPIYFYSKR